MTTCSKPFFSFFQFTAIQFLFDKKNFMAKDYYLHTEKLGCIGEEEEEEEKEHRNYPSR